MVVFQGFDILIHPRGYAGEAFLNTIFRVFGKMVNLLPLSSLYIFMIWSKLQVGLSWNIRPTVVLYHPEPHAKWRRNSSLLLSFKAVSFSLS